MAAITYKTIIHDAIDGFNAIQNKLNAIGAKDSDGNVIPAVSTSASNSSVSNVASLSTIEGSDAFTAGSTSASLSNTGLSTYFNSGTSSSNSISLTPKWSHTAGYQGDTSGNGSTSYYSIKTTSLSASAAASITTAPTVSTAVGTNATDCGFTTTQPDGTDGTDYYSISTTTTSGTAKATGTVSVGTGWITASSPTPNGTAAINVTSNDPNWYIPKSSLSIATSPTVTLNNCTISFDGDAGTSAGGIPITAEASVTSISGSASTTQGATSLSLIHI